MNAARLERLLAPLSQGPAPLLSIYRKAGSNLAMYTLTEAGVCVLQELGEAHACSQAGPGPQQAVERSLSMLYYCCMGAERFGFLNRGAVRERFGDQLPASPHALIKTGNYEIIERLYVPSSRMLASDVARHVSLDFTQRALSEPTVRAWIARGRYRIMLIADDEARIAELQGAIERRLLDASVPVRYALVQCEGDVEEAVPLEVSEMPTGSREEESDC